MLLELLTDPALAEANGKATQEIIADFLMHEAASRVRHTEPRLLAPPALISTIECRLNVIWMADLSPLNQAQLLAREIVEGRAELREQGHWIVMPKEK